MNEYRVFCEAQSYSILPHKANIELKFKTENETMRMRIDNVNAQDLLGRDFSKRLSVVMDLSAIDIHTAVAKCNHHTNQILDKIAFEVGMPVEELKILKAYQIADEHESIELVKFDHDALDKIGSKPLDIDRFNKIIESSTNDRINRAMHWYRKALNETDLLDIFTYLWISLETLNPLFQNLYPEAVEVSRCENCKFERKVTNTAPLKEFFIDVIGSEKLYRESRKIRQSIVHGFEDITKIQKRLIEIIDALGAATRKAIFYLIEVDDVDRQNDGIGSRESFVFVSYFKISNFISDEKNPRYFDPVISVEIQMTETNGELAIQPVIKTNMFQHGCGLAGLTWDIWGGDPGYPIRKIQIEIQG